MSVWPLIASAVFAFHAATPSVTFGALSQIKEPAVPVLNTVKTTPIPNHYTIALLGDSMIDTLGATVPDLTSGLTEFFPNDTFTLLNYGVGATTIDYGITRVTQPYTYLGKNIPSLLSRHPNLIIVESFAYNPYPEGDNGLPRYKEQLKILTRLLTTNLPGTPVVMAVTIAPDSKIFGDGAPGIAFSADEKRNRTEVIQHYLKTAVQFAKDNRLPLANAYTASLTNSGDGDPIYINQTDHIHYSAIGRMLFTQKILEAIETNHLIQ